MVLSYSRWISTLILSYLETRVFHELAIVSRIVLWGTWSIHAVKKRQRWTVLGVFFNVLNVWSVLLNVETEFFRLDLRKERSEEREICRGCNSIRTNWQTDRQAEIPAFLKSLSSRLLPSSSQVCGIHSSSSSSFFHSPYDRAVALKLRQLAFFGSFCIV